MGRPIVSLNPRRAARGSTLLFTVVLLGTVLAFMAASIYMGLSTYLQEELQKVVSTSAMVGASSMYDGATPAAPVKDVGKANQGLMSNYNRMLARSPALQSFTTSLVSAGCDGGSETCWAAAESRVPVPMLSLIGVNFFAIRAQATSKYTVQLDTTRRALVPRTELVDVAGGFGGGGSTGVGGEPSSGGSGGAGGGGFQCATLSMAPVLQSLYELIIPVTDRPGPDVHIVSERSGSGEVTVVTGGGSRGSSALSTASGGLYNRGGSLGGGFGSDSDTGMGGMPSAPIPVNGYRGYIVEACTDGGATCWDVSGAATFANPADGIVRDATLNGRNTRVIHGSCYIDLGASGAQYGGGVVKATYIRLRDDGENMVWADGELGYEICPGQVVIQEIDTYHVGTKCDLFFGGCPPAPAGFTYAAP